MAKLKKRSKLSQQRHKANQLLKDSNGEPISNIISKKGDSNKSIKSIALLEKLKLSNNISINEKLITINNILLQCNNDESIRKIFLKNDLIKILFDLLNQENQFDEILVSCFDLLKNLIIEEDYDLSIHLWRNDIWNLLVINFNKAFNSINHLNDSNVNLMSKDLLINYINNLIGVLDNLIMELNLDLIDNSIIKNLIDSNILNNLFNLLNLNDLSISLNFLQFIYDLSTISTNFLKNILLNNNFNLILNNLNFENSLAKIYLIGINLQILEIKNDLINNLDLIINEIFKILNKINLQNSKNDNEFQIIDISLDLLTTIIEIKGSNNNLKIDKFFNNHCINNILPFLIKLFEIDLLNNKKLICLNNLLIYLNSNNLISENLLNDLLNLNINKINIEFNNILSTSNDLEIIIDYINFKLNLLEIDNNKDYDETQINKLIEFGINLNKYDSNDIELKIQFITSLLIYLSLIAKNSKNIEIIKKIVNFIIKYNLIEPIEFYKNQLKISNISKFHKIYNYLIEESINLSINSIFEIFDDDYFYNKLIYHDENLNNLLLNILIDYKKIYKNIDKNLNFQLKKQTEETINNLQRFIEYKNSEYK